MALSSGFQKLGQPVPLSNLVSEENSGRSQPAQAKVPLRCSFRSGLDQGRSVPCLRRISYCCGVSCARHSASVFSISNFSVACAGDVLKKRKLASPTRPATGASRTRRSIMAVSGGKRAFWFALNTVPVDGRYIGQGEILSLLCDQPYTPS